MFLFLSRCPCPSVQARISTTMNHPNKDEIGRYMARAVQVRREYPVNYIGVDQGSVGVKVAADILIVKVLGHLEYFRVEKRLPVTLQSYDLQVGALVNNFLKRRERQIP